MGAEPPVGVRNGSVMPRGAVRPGSQGDAASVSGSSGLRHEEGDRGVMDVREDGGDAGAARFTGAEPVVGARGMEAPSSPQGELGRPVAAGAGVGEGERDAPEGEGAAAAVGQEGAGAEPGPGAAGEAGAGQGAVAEARALDERLVRAGELERQRDFRGAVALYLEVIAEDPKDPRARNNLGVLYDRIGAHELAIEQYEAARDLDPGNVEILSNLGAALGALGRFEAAERELRNALRIDPNRVDVRANLGILHFKRGLYAQAEAELRWVCEVDPNNAAAHFYRGEALNQLGRIDEALEALEQASRIQPGNSRAYYAMGILYDKKHLPEQAAMMYRKARELSVR